MPSTATPSKSAASKTPKSLLLTLKLSKANLKKFPHEEKIEEAPSSPASSVADTPNGVDAAVSTPNSSSVPTKKKGVPTPKPSLKRSASQTAPEAVPKARGKPGPKKKMKIDGVNGAPIPVSAPKINPKANTGAINANLRALDRTGKPCRRWGVRAFKIKSFTGVAWDSPTWASHRRATADVSTDGKSVDSSQTSDVPKVAIDSSAIASEKSNSGEGDTPMPTILEQGMSPAVAVA